MWLWLSMALAGASLYALAWCIGRPYVVHALTQASPSVLVLRLLWPWVEALALVCRPLMSWHVRRRYDALLQQAGLGVPWSAQHLCAIQTLAAICGAAFTVVLMWERSPTTQGIAGGLVAACGAAWPLQRLKRRIRHRKQTMLRELPFLLDMVTLCVEAGLNLHGALRQVVQHGPRGPLYDEVQRLLADIRTGTAREAAMEQWAKRCDITALHHFIAAVAQADQSGMSLGPVLRAQADQRRTERFQQAEKAALEAPVKLMFPLITCIFPCSFLIIAIPIAGKFMALAE